MQTLTREELKEMNQVEHEDFVLINVLSPEDFRKKHIRTSINLPQDDKDFEKMVEKVSGETKERKVVVYCASFECNASPKAAEKLEKAGFTQVYDYEGGTKDWFENREKEAA